MKVRTIILAMILLLPDLYAGGQDISVVADYPEVVSVGQQFNVSWTINSGGDGFTEPSFDGFLQTYGSANFIQFQYPDN